MFSARTSASSSAITHFDRTVVFIYIISILHFNLWQDPVAEILTILHVNYGLMLVLKAYLDNGDPSVNFAVPVLQSSIFGASLTVYLYWILCVLPIIMVGINRPIPTKTTLFWILGLFIWGIYFQFVADTQRVIFTKYKRRFKLLKENYEINDEDNIFPPFLNTNLWRLCRNPHLFGEILIYASFSMCAKSIIPMVYLIVFIFIVWNPLMNFQDEKNAKHEEFSEYQKKTAKLIPFLW
jgi:steroid 5-alpha reductase family enzyme